MFPFPSLIALGYVYTPAPAPQSEPVKPAPAVCPECWNTKPVDAERAWAAVVSMCGGRS